MTTDEITLPEYQGTPSRRWNLLPRSPATLLIVILIALVLAEAILLVRKDDDGGRTEVFQTSQRFIVLLTTFSATTLNEQREQVLAMAAGEFRDNYSELTDADFLRALRDNQAESKGRIQRLAVTSIEDDDAKALAVVEITTNNKNVPTPRVENQVMELTLVRSSKGWRIDAVAILGTIRQ